jgi:hypothetical protein
LTLYIYFTSLTKKLPPSNIYIINENNVNTAFTYSCHHDPEIVIFRKEEWFKVLLHETFHNYALDFSDMNTQREICNPAILSIFPVQSDVNLYEAYTEFWAEIMNVIFCSYYVALDQNSTSDDELLSNFDFFINFERTYGFFQMIKTLNFMGLTYKNLYSKKEESLLMRETLYKEDSNILAYYIIRPILLHNYQGFLGWCDKNNFSLLQFKKTNANLDEFCKFIEKNYKTKSMNESVDCMQKFMMKVNKMKTTKSKKSQSQSQKANEEDLDFTLSNMRMTICELG